VAERVRVAVDDLDALLDGVAHQRGDVLDHLLLGDLPAREVVPVVGDPVAQHHGHVVCPRLLLAAQVVFP